MRILFSILLLVIPVKQEKAAVCAFYTTGSPKNASSGTAEAHDHKPSLDVKWEVSGNQLSVKVTTNRAGGGTGLGMHIVYNLVAQSLGGTIRCESQVGVGTAFILHIPHDEGVNHG